MDVVELTPNGLAPADVIAVARGDARVAIGEAARVAMSRSAAVVEALAASEEPAYGITTGFGSAGGPVTVEILDGNGQLASGTAAPVTVAIGSDPGGGSLSGPDAR